MDHPRVGGEKPLPFLHNAGFQGSPPRGRGKGTKVFLLSGYEGITPAWAGKSVRDKKAPAVLEDHPRVGGEKTKKIP